MGLDVKQIKSLFIQESLHSIDEMDEYLGQSFDGLDVKTLDIIYRALHTIKGGSSNLKLVEIADLSQATERLSYTIQADPDTPVDAAIQVLKASIRCMRQMLLAEKFHQAYNQENIRLVNHDIQSLLQQKNSGYH